jgi:cytochrome P450
MTNIEAYNYLGLDEATIRDPFPFYKLLQAERPVYTEPEYGIFLVSRYRDVLEVVRQPDTFSSAMPTGPTTPPLDKLPPDLREAVEAALVEGRTSASGKRSSITDRVRTLLAADPPDHTRYRGLVNRVLNVRTARQWEPRIRQIANELVDAFVASGEVELVRAFAHPLPLRVVGELLGAPTDVEELSAMFGGVNAGEILGNPGIALSRMVQAAKRAYPADGEGGTARPGDPFTRYFTERIVELRERPVAGELISDLIQTPDDAGRHLDDAEILSIIGHFRVAGHETSTKMITAAVYYLVDQPAVMDAVRSDRALCENLVEETLRMEAPVQGLFRIATRDAVVGGVPVPSGSMLMMMYGAANRDEEQFPSPDSFDPRRTNARTHLAFGQGPHYCAGAPFARAEGRIALETLLDRLDDIRFAPGNSFERTVSYILRGLKELRLSFSAQR